MPLVNNYLGQKLTTLRGEKTLYRVEKESGVDRGQLRRYEIGETLPENESLAKLAAFYGVDFKELKMLYFEDCFPDQSQERNLLFEWVQSKKIGES